jgi:hypothetical protein
MYDIEKDYIYFLENEPNLKQMYRNQFILIREQQVIEGFDSFFAAYKKGLELFAHDKLCIQHCDPHKKLSWINQ